jgi:molybdenum cofactor cytidylyltransferase
MIVNIGIIVLAAGNSSRLGRPKQLLPYRGTSLLRHTLDGALKSPCRPVLTVFGANYEVVKKECSGLPVITTVNHKWSDGIGSSIRWGISELEKSAPGTAGVIIALCDQPKVDEQVFSALLRDFIDHGSPIAACEYGDSFGVPAFFARSFFDELLKLDDGQGAKKILAANRRCLTLVPFPGGAVDMDTPEDYQQLDP